MVELGFKCTKCPYWTGPRKRVPVRYTFTMLGSIVPSNKKKGKYAQMEVRLGHRFLSRNGVHLRMCRSTVYMSTKDGVLNWSRTRSA